MTGKEPLHSILLEQWHLGMAARIDVQRLLFRCKRFVHREHTLELYELIVPLMEVQERHFDAKIAAEMRFSAATNGTP